MTQRNTIWYNIDWQTVLIYLILIFLGWINIYAAVFNDEHKEIFDITQRYGKQLIWIGAAISLATVLLLLDSKFYVSFAYIIYGLSIASLIGVLIFGTEIKGAKSWFQIGAFAFQPAEFAKVATALAFAKYASSYSFKMTKIKDILILGAIFLFPVGLIFLQNDTGSALVFSVFLFVLYREGLSGIILFFVLLVSTVFILTLVLTVIKVVFIFTIFSFIIIYIICPQQIYTYLKAAIMYLLIFCIIWLGNYLLKFNFSSTHILLFSTFISSLIFAVYSFIYKLQKILIVIGIYIALCTFSVSSDHVFNNILEPHQQDRINELLGIENDLLGVGYNVNQSKIAIGSGGFTGKGFLNGTQTKFNFVPEQSTDFIFCTVGEEWGFAGTTIVLLLFSWLLLRLIYLAERQRSVFSRIYGYCVACILFFHLSINIGMTIGLAPVIGIPLPFFSYGGSSLWSFTILLFIFIRLDASHMERLSY